jgi:hypothetical protein
VTFIRFRTVERTGNNDRAHDASVNLGRAEDEKLRGEMAKSNEVGEQCHVVHSVDK